MTLANIVLYLLHKEVYILHVKVFESGCIKCDDKCYRFNSVSTCAHFLAVSK